jgi:hypothetical protein
MPPTPPTPQDRSAYRLAEQYLADGDDRFLPHLRTLRVHKQLVPIVEAWKRDPRPWARRQVLAYLSEPFTSPGHATVVKRLFKHAETGRDDVVMAHCLVAFDRMVRRKRRRRHHWDPASRSAYAVEELVTPRNDTLREVAVRMGPGAGQTFVYGRHLFSFRTRYYLRRRAWRYYRRTGFGLDGRSAHDDYVRAVVMALRLYTDADVAAGENLLDCWGLTHAMFGGGDVLEFGPSKAAVAQGKRLADLTAAPAHPHLWGRANAARDLLSLVVDAACRPVRAWAVELLRRHHLARLTAVDASLLLQLLDHPDDLVQQFAADLLEQATSLGDLTVDDWLRLLQTRNVAALDAIARAMRKHIRPDRLTPAQGVDVAMAEPVPVARLGLEFLRAMPVTPTDHAELARLADARSSVVGGEIAAWALGVLGMTYDVDPVSRFFDSANARVRAAAFDWVRSDAGALAYRDPALFARLLETPYDDVRLALVADLQTRAVLPGQGPASLSALWAGVLLGIHRGGRAKLTALRQVSDAVSREPAHAATLLPVLAVAIRSVRVPEARVGLSAIVTAVERAPALATRVASLLPELTLEPL